MANIDIKNISDLDLNGNSLFEDSEGFMTELSEDNEIEAINGGCVWTGCLGDTCTQTGCVLSVVVYGR